MDYNAFKDIIIERVRMVLPEGMHAEINAVIKNNGVKMDAMMIFNEKSNTGPAIYLKQAYEAYKKGASLNEVCDSLVRYGTRIVQTGPADLGYFKDYENVKNLVRPKLVNAEQNAQILKTQPYVPFLDLAVTFAIDLGSATFGVMDMFFDSWGITLDELYETAMENMPVPKIVDARERVTEDMDKDEARKIASFLPPLYVLTNTEETFGSSAIAKDGVLKQCADYLEHGLYIMPSSIHQCLLVPIDDGGEAMEAMSRMVRDVNMSETVEKQDILADHAYYYDRKTEKITYSGRTKQDDA